MPDISQDEESAGLQWMPPVLAELRDFVVAECTAQRMQYEERMALPQAERERKGICLSGLKFDRLEAGTGNAARFLLAGGNEATLREGDMVRLHRGDPRHDYRQGTIFREDGDALWLHKYRGEWDDLWLSAGATWVLDLDHVDLEAQYLAALEAAGSTVIGREHILPLLEGAEPDEPDFVDMDDARESLSEAGLNETQEDAAAAAVAAPHCHLVQGPPGTGKTHVLAEVVAQCVEAGERVFLTGFTHRAIHHALDAVVKRLGDAERVIKVSQPVWTGTSAWKTYDTLSASPLADELGGYVVGGTPFAAQSRLKAVTFDRVIVDESGQMTVVLAIMAMLKAKRWTFFGDDQQLGPVLVSVKGEAALAQGCFRRLRGVATSTMLREGYRMNSGLTYWPSENFYSGELRAVPAVAGQRLALREVKDADLAAILNPDDPLVWVPFSHTDSKLVNKEEAVMAARLIVALIDGGVSPQEIAVVVPWRRQARCIRTHLKGRLPETTLRQVVVDTVERMQGQERQVVLVSLASSDRGWLEQMAGFLGQPNRLNVAVTRARVKTIVLASEALFSVKENPDDPDESLGHLHSLLLAAVKVEG